MAAEHHLGMAAEHHLGMAAEHHLGMAAGHLLRQAAGHLPVLAAHCLEHLSSRSSYKKPLLLIWVLHGSSSSANSLEACR
jgi:hypothetical protein